MIARREGLARFWHRFSRNPLSLIGLALVLIVALGAILAPWVTPYPEHAGRYVNFAEAGQPPSFRHLLGTDTFGRDLFSRVLFGYRTSLLLGVVVLALAVPVGVLLGLMAGYLQGRIGAWIMRIADVFVAVPPLVLAMAVLGVAEPSLFNAMMALTLMWWPWYTRMVYNQVRGLRVEGYVVAAQVVGAPTSHILFHEILPNCLPSVLTKLALDMGFVILIGASLSFLGLGVQPPTPDLGTMVAEGARYLPDLWWLAVFPGVAILLVVLGFNLLADGLRDAFGEG